jgi:23S rRNA pseudouridine1911/1915/1917 synthase
MLDAARILFEDHHLIVVNKPAGLLTQAPATVPSLEAVVKESIRVRYAKPGGVYLAVPHRLDRPVSGVIAFARNTKAGQRLQAQFEARTVRKVYWAIVAGVPSTSPFEWTDWLRKVPDVAHVEVTEPEATGAKQAVLTGRVVQPLSENTFLELEPQTGRMHQLRVQCAHHGHPILGDHEYGSTTHFGPDVELDRDRWIALHARTLEFDHPFTRQRLSFTAPLSEAWPAVESPV